MKKLVIQNLKDAFNFGLSFKDLALLEDTFLRSEDFAEVIVCNTYKLEFLSASINKFGKKTIYYKFIAPF